MKPALIVLGNPLLSDEGVGVHILRSIERRVAPPRPYDVVDSGNSSMRILHALKGREKAVFVDCAMMGVQPGEIRRFSPEDVASSKLLPGLSLHEGDLFSTLDLAKKLGDHPQQVVIYGIQPASLEPGENLSPVLATDLDRYVERILKELEG